MCLCGHKLSAALPICLPQRTLENVPDGHILSNIMNKKSIIKFRCTSLEKAIIEKKASHSGTSTSSFVRAAALDQKVTYRFTEEELEIFKMLLKYHKNFTALSNLFKAKDPSLSNEVKVLADEIKQHLKRLQ